MVSVCIFTSGGPDAPALGPDLQAAGLDLRGTFPLDGMVQGVIRTAPDVVVCYENHPGDALFAVTAALADTAPRPTVLFTADPDAEKIERAAAAGVHAYIVNGYAPHRLRSVIHVAQARFRRDRALRDELTEVRDRFAERKLVDRAKGILMRVRDVPEEDAFRALRSAAMQQKQRIGQVAQTIIDATRYAEAVNRAGQLRMLSQRIVKLCAFGLAGIAPERTAMLYVDSVAQADANLAVLGRTLSRATFGDLLDGVLGPWKALKAASSWPLPAGRSGVVKLVDIDRSAERLLVQAEALTRNLEAAGFTAELRLINVSGRQRMLSQRLAKVAAMKAVLGRDSAEAPDTAGRARADFIEGMAFLEAIPLSTDAIQAELSGARAAWWAFDTALAGGRPGLDEVAELSEVLLARFSELTTLYEQSLKVLLG